MQENEFERQVRQKMDEVKLNPSGAVWQKIEVQIKKEKRRRWVLFLLPLLLIGSLYGGYVLFNSNNSNSRPTQEATKNVIEKNDPAKKPTADPDPVKNNYAEKDDYVIKDDKETNNQTPIIKSNRDHQIKPRSKPKLNRDYIITESLAKDTLTLIKITDAGRNVAQHEKTKTDIQNTQQEKITGNNDSITSQIEISPGKSITNIAKDENAKNLISPDTPRTKIKLSNKYSWNRGIVLAGGVSSMANSFLGYGQQSFDGTQFPNNYPGTVSGPYPLGPSLIKPSLAFIAGVSAERNLSKKIMFTTGLTYKLYSTTNTVGSDSSGYYQSSRSNNAGNTYHNYYHYMELPVGIKFQIADFKKIRLYWNTGFSISQLISSNALQFNMSTQLYYKDNSLLNKTQFGFNNGFDLAIITKQNQSLLIGPYFNYGISKIARQGYNKHHFTFIGLRAQYFFNKK